MSDDGRRIERIDGIDHLGIAVESLEAGMRFWGDALGLEVGGIETVEGEQVKVAFFPVGGSKIELLEPTAPGSPIARHLERRGAGIHHVTLAVRDLTAVLERVRAHGATVLGDGDGIRSGAGGTRVAFLHPKSTGGVLVELCERAGVATRSSPRLEVGSAVLLYLREPAEKLWGVLRRLDPTGVVLEGIDLGSFDDWVAQVERTDEQVVGPSVLFIPMTRVEKILLDRSSGDLPSLSDRFLRRTGRTVQDALDEGDG